MSYRKSGQATFRPKRFADRVTRSFQRKFHPVFDPKTRDTLVHVSPHIFKEDWNPIMADARKKSEGKVEAGVGGMTWGAIEVWTPLSLFGQGQSRSGSSPGTLIAAIGADAWKTHPFVDINDKRGQFTIASSFSMRDLLDALKAMDPNSMLKLYASKYPNDEGDTFSLLGIRNEIGQWVILYAPELVASNGDKHYGLAEIPFEPA